MKKLIKLSATAALGIALAAAASNTFAVSLSPADSAAVQSAVAALNGQNSTATVSSVLNTATTYTIADPRSKATVGYLIVNRTNGQINPTNGLYLQNLQGVQTAPNSYVVTPGAQNQQVVTAVFTDSKNQLRTIRGVFDANGNILGATLVGS